MIEVALDVGIYHPPASNQSCFNHLDRLLRTPFWPKTIRVVLEVGFKDWLNDYLARLLHHSVSYRWYP